MFDLVFYLTIFLFFDIPYYRIIIIIIVIIVIIIIIIIIIVIITVISAYNFNIYIFCSSFICL